MKRQRIHVSMLAALLITLLATISFGGAAFAEPVTVDYREEIFYVGENEHTLVYESGPAVLLTVEKDEVVLVLQTTLGEVRYNFPVLEFKMTEAVGTLIASQIAANEQPGGAMTGTATDNAAEQRTEPEAEKETGEATAQPSPSPDPKGLCKQCGNPLSTGNHEKLRCGHYACKVGENHPVVCRFCNRFNCNSANHTDICGICGKHVCTRSHRENCRATSPSTGNELIIPGYRLPTNPTSPIYLGPTTPPRILTNP